MDYILVTIFRLKLNMYNFIKNTVYILFYTDCM